MTTTTTEPTTTTEATEAATKPAFLSPAEYARALGHTRLLASQAVTTELETLKARRRAIADTKRRLDEAEAALRTRAAKLTTAPEVEVTIQVEETIEETTTPEPITPVPEQAATLTPPPAPEEPRWSPVPPPLNNLDADWSPAPAPRDLPPVDRHNAASVKAWAEARWPEHPDTGARRLQVLEAETVLASVSAVARNTEYGQKLVKDRDRKRRRNHHTNGNTGTQRNTRATGGAVRASGSLMVGRVAL